MTEQQVSARERILAAAVELLQAGEAGSITMRRLAEQAGVGVGLINYHFGSKGRLLELATAELLGDSHPGDSGQSGGRLDPETRIRRALRARLRPLEVNPGLASLLAEGWLQQADLDDAEAIAGWLGELERNGRTELEIRTLALLLWLLPTFLALHPHQSGRFLGLDLMEWPGRESAMDVLARLALGRGERRS